VWRSNFNLDWATHGLSLKKIGKYKINMIDSDQCPDSNWRPLLKSHPLSHYLKSRADLRVFSNLCPFQILRSMIDLLARVYVSDVHLRKWETVIDLRIGKRTQTWGTDVCEVEIGHGFGIGRRLEAGRWSESYKYKTTPQCFDWWILMFLLFIVPYKTIILFLFLIFVSFLGRFMIPSLKNKNQ
jgi:hypothetical protein